jgi:hypothetical protein
MDYDDTKVKVLILFFGVTIWFLGEGDPSNPEFSRELSKVWPRNCSIHESNSGSPE